MTDAVEPEREGLGVELAGLDRAVELVRARGAVAVVRVTPAAAVPAAPVLRGRGRVRVGRFRRHVQTGQEVVVKEAAHRLPSLGPV